MNTEKQTQHSVDSNLRSANRLLREKNRALEIERDMYREQFYRLDTELKDRALPVLDMKDRLTEGVEKIFADMGVGFTDCTPDGERRKTPRSQPAFRDNNFQPIPGAPEYLRNDAGQLVRALDLDGKLGE